MRDNENRTTTLEPPVTTHDANRDPLTGEPGSHPVGTGVGAVGGAATGAAVGGAVAGPAGALIGAAVGGLAGGLAGKGIAESVNPTEEDAYWRGTYASRPYASGRSYDDLAPAYRYGWESRAKHAGDKAEQTWDQAQSNLEQGWDKVKGESRLKWQDAKDATKDAWNRVDSNLKEDRYWRDNYATRPYASGSSYDDYAPAYRYGRDARTRYAGRPYEAVENDLERGWDKAKGASKLGWDKAKDAVKDAWHGVERALPGDADGDGR